MREFGLLESIRFHATASRAAASIDNGAPDLQAAIPVIAASVDKDPLRVAGLPQPDLDTLIKTWRHLNGVIFIAAEEPEERKGRAKARTRWRDIYCTLIAAGHDPRRIGQYTQRQIELYFSGAQRLLAQDRSARIIDFNAAQAGGKHADSVVSRLQKVAE